MVRKLIFSDAHGVPACFRAALHIIPGKDCLPDLYRWFRDRFNLECVRAELNRVHRWQSRFRSCWWRFVVWHVNTHGPSGAGKQKTFVRFSCHEHVWCRLRIGTSTRRDLHGYTKTDVEILLLD